MSAEGADTAGTANNTAGDKGPDSWSWFCSGSPRWLPTTRRSSGGSIAASGGLHLVGAESATWHAASRQSRPKQAHPARRQPSRRKGRTLPWQRLRQAHLRAKALPR